MLNVKDLVLSYNGKVIAEDINFSLKKGDYAVVVGDNGSGKTTLIKAILGLKKSDNGSINFDGITLNDISYLPQQSGIQSDFPASVLEIVLSGRLSQRKLLVFYNKSDKAHALFCLEKLGIKNLANTAFSELSGGQQQRVLLARALCADAKLLILDEPVNGLDRDARTDFYKLLTDLNKNGMTLLMVTHDAEAESFANNIINIEGVTNA